jgi:hypothetical protein
MLYWSSLVQNHYPKHPHKSLRGLLEMQSSQAFVILANRRRAQAAAMSRLAKAEAGIQPLYHQLNCWTPAFAGVTTRVIETYLIPAMPDWADS